MKTIYEHTTNTSRIEAVERWDGSTGIMMTCGIGTTHEAMMRYPLPIIESDKFGAALCKDTINNYMDHASNLSTLNVDLQYRLNEYKETLRAERLDHIAEKRAINQIHHGIQKRNDSIIKELESSVLAHVREHNRHTHQLYARIDYLEAINMGLNSDVSTLRMTNTLYRKRWNDHEVRQ